MTSDAQEVRNILSSLTKKIEELDQLSSSGEENEVVLLHAQGTSMAQIAHTHHITS
jgi:hypothetical protein